MVSRYWYTLRHLRPVQIYGRLWFRLYHPKPELGLATELRPVKGKWAPTLAKPVAMLGPTTFRFLNHTHEVASPDAWNDPDRDKLWLYNLHYFDDLNAEDAPVRQDWHLALLQRWIAENPPGEGNGWEPYPTSLRMVNWIKWALGGQRLPPDCQQSLAVQARWLSRRLEVHLLGNHLSANAKALVFAGAFFVGPEADRWRGLGLRLLKGELEEQILADGGHFERSPMYHAILLEDVLDLINLAVALPGLFGAEGSYTLTLWRRKAAAMLGWLAVMCHPDGEISFFNDAAMGIAPTLAELNAYGRRLGVSTDDRIVTRGQAPGDRDTLPSEPIWLRDSGYIRLAAGPAVALLDVAPVGPDYLPGHAHADTLSCEVSLFGQRVIVNGGTSRYGNGPERLAERSTAAHSTVQIDNANSSEVWGGFRVARRARPFDVTLSCTPAPSSIGPCATQLSGVQQVTAAHDGYRRLPGLPVHRRTWHLTEGHFAVIDTIVGEYRTAIARFLLHPAIRVAMDPGGEDDMASGYLCLPEGQRVRWQCAGGSARFVPVAWHPQFGLSQATQCLEISLVAAECQLRLEWELGVHH